MYDSIVYDLQAMFCQSMSHPARQKIIHILFEGPKSVGEIAQLIGLGQSNVSRHLAILRRSGVVISERRGQENYYWVASPKIIEVCSLMRIVLSEQASEKSEMMKNLPY